jgi:hypothetical protein
VWLRVSSTANRRSVAFDVDEFFIADDESFVPLVVEVTLRQGEASVQGEVACVTALRPGVRAKVTALEASPEVGRAHADFYDREYFASKRSDVTRKYRKLVARQKPHPHPAPPPSAQVEIVQVGPGQATVAPASPFLDVLSVKPHKRRGDPRVLEHVTFGNAIGMRATYDGQTLHVTTDTDALAAAASEVERTWGEVFGATAVQRDQRALWYLTKYVTPHPPGDPHFFVKPFAFTRTPAGWSSIVEGMHGEGYDVLRGVVSTDSFFATPAVFHVWSSTAAIRVAAGTPLVRIFAIPRELLSATWRRASFHDDPVRSSA